MVQATANAETPPPLPTVEPKGFEGLMVLAGRILTGLLILLLLMSAGMKLAKPDFFLKEWEKFGYQEHHTLLIGLVELACVAIYAIPQTSVLGAILLTAYLGGATATHVRIDDPFQGPVAIGVAVWAALFLRYSHVRALIPWNWSR